MEVSIPALTASRQGCSQKTGVETGQIASSGCFLRFPPFSSIGEASAVQASCRQDRDVLQLA